MKRKTRLAAEMVLPYLEEFPSLDDDLTSAYETLRGAIEGMGSVEPPKTMVQALKALEAALYQVAGKKIASHLVLAAIDPAQVEKFKKSKGKNLFKETVTSLLQQFMKGQEAGAEKEYVDQAVKAGSKLLMGSFDFIYNNAIETMDSWVSTTTGEPTEEILGRTHAYDILDRISYLTALKGVLETADPDTWESQKTTVERKLGKLTNSLAESIWKHGLGKKGKKKLKKVDPTDEASKLKAALLKVALSGAKQTIPKVLKELERFAAQVLEYSVQEEAEQKAAGVKKALLNPNQPVRIPLSCLVSYFGDDPSYLSDYGIEEDYAVAIVPTLEGHFELQDSEGFLNAEEIREYTPYSASEMEDLLNYCLRGGMEKELEEEAKQIGLEMEEYKRLYAQAKTRRRKETLTVRRRRKPIAFKRRRRLAVLESVEDELYLVASNMLADRLELEKVIRAAYKNAVERDVETVEEALFNFDNAAKKLKEVVQELHIIATL